MRILLYDKVYDTEKESIETIKDDLMKRMEKKEGCVFPFYISIDDKAREVRFSIYGGLREDIEFENDTIVGADATMLLGKPLPCPCLFGYNVNFERKFFVDIFKDEAKTKAASKVMSVDIIENEVMIQLKVKYGE